VPETKIVVVVARTRMYGDRVCVGALSEAGENFRSMNPSCGSDRDQDSPYRVGEKWEVFCAPCGTRKPPHLEDVAVSRAKKLGEINALAGYIRERAKPWEGAMDALFEGKLQFTRNGAGFISEGDIPRGATGFWIPSRNLHLEHDDRGKAGYYPEGDYRHLSYVGTQDTMELIKAGQLVRVSLARWWRPQDADPDFEERCYAQLSGWY
jgi:hypothetical protein